MGRDTQSWAEHGPEGRWGGRLTSRPLPAHDDSIEALTRAERDEIAAHWLGRAAFERRVGDAFEVIRDALRALGTDPDLIALAARAVDDELRHAELSRVVASRFSGRELPAPERLPLVVPAHRGAQPSLRHTLHVIGQCALNETFASSVLEASLARAEGSLAQAALRELLSDEIDHARLGWAHLATLDADARASVAPWLFGMLRANLRMWREAPRDYTSDPRLIAHGAMSHEMVEDALLRALTELVLPGLAHVGFETAELAEWVARGAPTD